jgi:hypothetical protein
MTDKFYTYNHEGVLEVDCPDMWPYLLLFETLEEAYSARKEELDG